MSDTQYPDMVKTLFKTQGFNAEADAMLHAAVGVAGEAGELLDAVKKVWAYGKVLDYENAIEELGDLEFYMEALRQQIGVSREDVLQANQEKLAKRYPGFRYSDSHAQARLDKVPEGHDEFEHHFGSYPVESTVGRDRYQP